MFDQFKNSLSRDKVFEDKQDKNQSTPLNSKNDVPISTTQQICIAICNQKGGCSKTTTAINLSSCLAEKGYRVLLIDLDAQAHASLGLGVDIEQTEKSTYDVLINNAGLEDVIQKTSVKNLDIASANVSLADAQLELATVLGRESILRIAIHKLRLRKKYQYTIIDCSPSLNLVTLNAIVAADYVIIPVQTHYYSLEGMKELFSTIDIVKERLNFDVKILGILATLFDKRTKVSHRVLEQIQNYFKDLVFRTPIHYNVKLCEAPIYKKPIHLYARTSQGAKDFWALTQEVIERTLAKDPQCSQNVNHLPVSESLGAGIETIS